MARVIIECKDCGARYDVTRRKPRSKVRCKSCSAILKIPGKDKTVTDRERAVPVGESDRSMRVKRAVEKGHANPEAIQESGEFSPGEEIQGLAKPARLEELSAVRTIKKYLALVKMSIARYVLMAIIAISAGFILAVVALFLIAVVLGQEPDAQQLFSGVTAILTAMVALVGEGAGILFGRKILTETDEGWKPIPGFKAAFSDAWGSLKVASGKIFQLALSEIPLYAGVLLAMVIIAVCFKIPGLGPLLGSLAVLAFIPLFLFLGVYSRLVKVGFLVEERSLKFSLKRAWLIMNDKEAIIHLALLSFLQGPIVSAIVTVFQVLANIVVFLIVISNPLAVSQVSGAVAMIFALALNGLFFATVHFELTKDEGLV